MTPSEMTAAECREQWAAAHVERQRLVDAGDDDHADEVRRWALRWMQAVADAELRERRANVGPSARWPVLAPGRAPEWWAAKHPPLPARLLDSAPGLIPGLRVCLWDTPEELVVAVVGADGTADERTGFEHWQSDCDSRARAMFASVVRAANRPVARASW